VNINTVARIAYSLAPKERNKQAVFDVAVKLSEGELVTEDNLAVLYAQNIDHKPPVPRTPEKWVASAVCGKDDIREYLQYVYSDGTRIIGTDGHRMHIWKTDKYPKGFYHPKTMDKSTVPDDYRYPDVDRVIPKTFREDYVSSATIEVEQLSISSEGHPIIIYKVGPAAVNAQYLDAALAGFKGETTLIHYVDANSAIKIDADDKLAVVMPVRQ